ncbi:MAG: phosphotransferase [Verrucomicrobia bacterium]|nr:phosphotransferase [Verrucomicrobiota bacterium]
MQEILEKCAIPAAHKIKLLSYTKENSSYLLLTKKGKYVLTHLSDPYKEETARSWALSYGYFVEKGCPFPPLLFVGPLEGRLSFITHYAEGKVHTTWQEKDLEEVGFFLGTFHKISETSPYKIPSLPYATSLYNEYLEIKEKLPKEFFALHKAVEGLHDSWPDHLPKGILHTDIWQKNVLFEETKISSILNFIHPSYDLFLLDIAKVLKTIFFRENKEALFSTFLTAYQMLRPLSQEELNHLDLAISSTQISTILRFLKQGLLNPKTKEQDFAIALSHFYKWRASVS